MLTRNVPMVEKVKREIVSGIASKEFIDEYGRLPSQEEFSRIFGVSRSTIRNAITSLEESGLVTRRHGVGTYVNDIGIPPTSVWGWLEEATTFEDLIRSSGHVAKTVLTETSFRDAGPAAAPLHVDEKAPVLWIVKVVYSDETPVICSDISIPLALADTEVTDWETVRADCAKSVYRILEEHFNAKVHHQTSEVRGGAAWKDTARYLNYQEGDPILCLEEVGYDAASEPIYHAKNRFRADLVSFRMVRKPALNISPIT